MSFLSAVASNNIVKLGVFISLGVFACYIGIQTGIINDILGEIIHSIITIENNNNYNTNNKSNINMENRTSLFNSKIDKGHSIARELVKKSELPGWYYSKDYDEGDKGYVLNDAYKISGTLPSSTKAIVSLLYDNFETTSSWNSDVAFSKIITKINPSTDIAYQKTKKIAMVSPRDFVMLRHYESLDDGGFVLAWISDSWKDNVPKVKDTVRGNYKVSGWILRPSADGRKSQYDLILDVTLGIPFLWDSIMLKSTHDTCVYLRKKLSTL